MKRCDKKEDKQDEFPDVIPGDTVRFNQVGSPFDGSEHLVINGRHLGRHYNLLASLHGGGVWSNESTFGFSGNGESWTKITCCYTVEDE